MVDGSSYNFLFYEDGVFSDTNCGCEETNLNHAMLLVGYVAYEESQQSYWILKNRFKCRGCYRPVFSMTNKKNLAGSIIVYTC